MFRNILKYQQIINIIKPYKSSSIQNYLLIKNHELRRFISLEVPKFTISEETTSIVVDNDRKLKILQLEADVARQEGQRVPDSKNITDEHWKHLLTLNSRSARRKYFGFLWQIEKKKESSEIKKIQRKDEIAKRKEIEKINKDNNDHIIYGLTHTSILLRIYDSTINHWHNNKLTRAMQFGQKLILDCSYDNDMTLREAINAAKQLMLCFSDNRDHNEPFDLHICNADMNKTTMEYLHRHIPTMLKPEFPLNIHKECFTEIFPKERLVYLTPHCRNDLEVYNHDDIYIIGCMVDKINNEPLSLAKAKKLGLRMARLPLDRYLQWNSGSGKSLTINQMVDILLDVKMKNDWKSALRHVPQRKILNSVIPKNEAWKFRSKSEKYKFNIDNWGTGKKKRIVKNNS